jgi:hypothetical protein
MTLTATGWPDWGRVSWKTGPKAPCPSLLVTAAAVFVHGLDCFGRRLWFIDISNGKPRFLIDLSRFLIDLKKIPNFKIQIWNGFPSILLIFLLFVETSGSSFELHIWNLARDSAQAMTAEKEVKNLRNIRTPPATNDSRTTNAWRHRKWQVVNMSPELSAACHVKLSCHRSALSIQFSGTSYSSSHAGKMSSASDRWRRLCCRDKLISSGAWMMVGQRQAGCFLSRVHIITSPRVRNAEESIAWTERDSGHVLGF